MTNKLGSMIIRGQLMFKGISETKTGKGFSLSQRKDDGEARIQLSAEQVNWKDDTNDEPEDQELEAHYMYMAKIQEVTPDAADNSGPIFDDEPLQKVHNSDDNYNVFANVRQQPESVMCLSSWGRNIYARVLMEVSAEKELMKSIVIVIPLSNENRHTLAKVEKGHNMAKVDVEYELEPPGAPVDGFVEVKKKKNKNKQPHHPKHIDGIRLGKPSLNVYYHRINAQPVSNDVSLKNSFSSLNDDDTEWEDGTRNQMAINASDSKADEELILESPNATRTTKINDTGASTPADVVTYD
ncbi:hypothetical protein Tco_1222009 [Tanacetum coccineum]